MGVDGACVGAGESVGRGAVGQRRRWRARTVGGDRGAGATGRGRSGCAGGDPVIAFTLCPGHSRAGNPAIPQMSPLAWNRSFATCCSTCRPVARAGAVTHEMEVGGGDSPTGAIPAGPKSTTTAIRFCPRGCWVPGAQLIVGARCGWRRRLGAVLGENESPALDGTVVRNQKSGAPGGVGP